MASRRDWPDDVTFRPSAIPAVHAEDVMTARKWSDLGERTRWLLVVAGVAEVGLKTAALIDIKRRPANQIRGPKWVWAMALVPVGSFGALPLAYFAFGRRR
jgi:hypothetical protein